jgi:thiol:disulfide interchange protein DsbA
MKSLLSTLLLLTGLVVTGLVKADYQRLDTPIPQQAAPGKVVVQQFLWYQCKHCYQLEGAVKNWLAQDKPDFITFERIPVAWSDQHLAQGAFYTAATALYKQRKLDQEGLDRLNDGLFDLHFVQQKPMDPANALPLFKDLGIDTREQLLALLDSPQARAERVRSHELTLGFRISSVPVFVVAGKYLVSFSTLSQPQSPEKLFATINQLAAQERPRPLITPFVIRK